MAKKQSALTATVTVFAPSVSYLDGELLNVDNGAVTIKFKKPRSSKYAIRSIPRSQIVYLYENAEESQVAFYDRVEQVAFTGEVTHNEDGSLTVVDEDGVATTIASGVDVEIFADVEDEPKAKKEKAKAKPKAKAKVEEDEEDEDEEELEESEEDEDEDEEEEEEKPKSKAKKDQGKAKSKAKAKVEEEDEDDW